MRILRARYVVVACGLVLGTCGCASFGPRELERSSGRYNNSVHEVEQEELLRNLVRMRYNDTPTSLNLTSIAAQYELTGQAEARPFFGTPNSSGNIPFKSFSTVLPDVLIEGANRPTLSFIPGDDSQATHQFLTPISAETLAFLGQSGWPVSAMLRVWVERLNGVPNANTVSNPPRGLVPDFARFQRIAELFQRLQDREDGALTLEERNSDASGALPASALTASAVVDAAKDGFEFQTRDGGKTWVLVRHGRRLVLQINPGKEMSPDVVELQKLLNLKPGLWTYELVATGADVPDPLRFPAPASTTLHLLPRSMAQVYYFLANGVEVPEEHLRCGLAPVAVEESGVVFDQRAVTRGLFEVHVARGHKPPPCAWVAVRYRDLWYYIDDCDQASKSTFGMVLQLSRLDFKKQQLGAGPFLTLPAGR